MSLKFADETPDALPIHMLGPDELAPWLAQQPERVRSWVEANGFSAASGAMVLIPSEEGRPEAALVGLGPASRRGRDRFVLAQARASLPEGVWRLASRHGAQLRGESALGWLLAGYRFGRYAEASFPKASMTCPQGCDRTHFETVAAGEALTRDLINTPSNDMGPDELEAAARALADAFGADMDVTRGDELLERNLPLIHAVGRASSRAPRLIDMSWGETGPTVVLVGKGVCFDTGGLNLKPGASMGTMKKDMGGAATVLGLARMIMSQTLRLRLRVLIPAVENSVSGNAFRPGDILPSRKGLSVEINNTDAEGRLVLADAIALAVEETPDLLISMATLTGAARVALGPDIAPFFTDDEPLAEALSAAGRDGADPVWRLPFWEPYEPMIEPGIADLDNAPKGGFAGAITAALFLRRFAEGVPRYAHFDIYGWQPSAAPGRPKGGVGQGARAILGALPDVLGL
ncbi:leucyl aminopeptidase family protein [Profundibacterium mesophilum]|uniref:Leucyl aminopeptidase n=1 Tax=Profundibacterium mesophilum KAUST100406-0324 TaxID=1037889 RepID=A0A921NXF0_9RHOB|nr:leucyl aminopeptidase family protein [Profundibacterium mesophilum]KAF0676509.1 leucyl aminopeptidase [Profundibacterium mesophilum KAUST100406-0324]